MSNTPIYSSDVAFTPAVKAIQARKGSREAYANVEARGGWRTEIDESLAAFLRTRWRSPITAVTGNTSRKAICLKIPRLISS
jgi:hypothetical protein